nr:hypothetical protein [Escherichia coli]
MELKKLMEHISIIPDYRQAWKVETTPSVAEQEGQLIETEATGAPQKHHHTLNQ